MLKYSPVVILIRTRGLKISLYSKIVNFPLRGHEMRFYSTITNFLFTGHEIFKAWFPLDAFLWC